MNAILSHFSSVVLFVFSCFLKVTIVAVVVVCLLEVDILMEADVHMRCNAQMFPASSPEDCCIATEAALSPVMFLGILPSRAPEITGRKAK